MVFREKQPECGSAYDAEMAVIDTASLGAYEICHAGGVDSATDTKFVQAGALSSGVSLRDYRCHSTGLTPVVCNAF